MSESPSPHTPRYRYLDSLRALAALAVVWMHVSEFHVIAFKEVARRGTGLYDFAWMIDLGRVGVSTFFVISGFVIPPSLRGPKAEAIRRFIVRRFWRLYPAYWVAVVLGYLAVRWLYSMPMTPLIVLANFTMFQEFLGAQSIMGHFWTLQVELCFYLLCVVLFATGVLRRFWFIVALVLGMAMVSRHGVMSKQALLCMHLCLMFWGSLFRTWNDEGRPIKSSKALALLVTACAFVPVDSIFRGLTLGDDHLTRYGLGYTAGLVWFVLGATLIRLESRLLAYLGEISYSIYLFHPVLFYAVGWWLRQPGAPVWLTNQHLSVYLIVYTLLTIVLAMVIYHVVEQPAIRIGQALTKSRAS